jgi:hypothetical protein
MDLTLSHELSTRIKHDTIGHRAPTTHWQAERLQVWS